MPDDGTGLGADSLEMDPDVRNVLAALALRKNVIVSGCPATGKSRLINQVRDLFCWDQGTRGSDPDGDIPLPEERGEIPPWFPSPDRTEERLAFETVFDQNTKYRDFMRGLVPRIDEPGAFKVTSGTLYRASVHALADGNAALVIIDEINRGPAVAAFGSALVGLEPDKRLGPDGVPTESTQRFEILDDHGDAEQFALPADVYILGAMNEADTSVGPLDVAFLRRFAPYRLVLRPDVVRRHLDLPDEPAAGLKATPDTAADIYEALFAAWTRLNRKILLARGAPYQLGHGALLHRDAPQASPTEAAVFAAEAWETIRSHLDEVFFGDTRAMVDVLGADDEMSPYTLDEEQFAGQTVSRIVGPIRPTSDELYRLFRSVAAQ